jgi:hypothetical protein
MFFSAARQDMQVSVQAWLQQTPWVQNPDSQSVASLHTVPFGSRRRISAVFSLKESETYPPTTRTRVESSTVAVSHSLTSGRLVCTLLVKVLVVRSKTATFCVATSQNELLPPIAKTFFVPA